MNPASRNLTQDAIQRGAKTTAKRAREAASSILPIVIQLRGQGLSLAQIAAELELGGYRTQRGTAFRATQVKRIIDRYGDAG